MLVLSAQDIDGLITPKEAVDTMEEAFRVQERGTFVMPDRMHVDFGENTLLLMPAFSGNVFSTKLVSLFPENKSQGLPPLYGTVILNDGRTGAPLALLNGASVTALRTGAVGGVAMRHMVKERRVIAGIIGAGTQGIQQALFACSELNVIKLLIFDTSSQRKEVFRKEFHRVMPELDLEFTSKPDHVVQACNVVITATNSNDPVFTFHREWVQDTTFIAIGSYKPDMQELPDELYHLATQVFIDTPLAMRESGDLVQPLEDGVLKDSRIFLLGELITGQVRLDDQPVKIFKSVGMALFDLLMASLLCRRASEEGLGTSIEL